VEEGKDEWREVVVYRRKSDGFIVLWFGGDEYEGLDGGYRLGYHGPKMALYEPSGTEIKWRTHDEGSTLDWDGPGGIQG